MTKETGIILKKLSAEGHTFVVLCLALGKINLVVLNKHQKKQLRSGSVIVFTAKEHTSTLYTTENIELQAGLLTKNAAELYWFHLLFEICYYFVPLHQPVFDIFAVLYSCVTQAHQQNFDERTLQMVQKGVSGCLFLLLGFSPPQHLVHVLITIKRTLLLFVDITNEQKVELCNRYVQVLNNIPLADLDRWVLECIQSHPSVQSFKTICFVYPPQHK